MIHSLFSAVAANCVLHLTVHLVATLAFFSTLRLTAGVRRAYLATSSSHGAVQSSTSEGIEVQTPGGRFDYAFTYPVLEMPAAGRYRFVLRYSPRAGQLAFGGFPADGSRWLASVQSRPNRGRHSEEATFSLDLNRGDSVVFRMANSNSRDRPSAFTIEDVFVYLLAPAR